MSTVRHDLNSRVIAIAKDAAGVRYHSYNNAFGSLIRMREHCVFERFRSEMSAGVIADREQHTM